MWDDQEDNNPYGLFSVNHEYPSQFGLGRKSSPLPAESASPHLPQGSTEFITHSLTDFDYDDNNHSEEASKPQKATYNSRVEQILYENPDIPILITHAGKNIESGGSFITYTIRTADIEVRRRYSEFASLRQTLVNLHPTIIIPPIPEKHSMADYAIKPTKAKQDAVIIDLRKRMLAVFLNRCRRLKAVREDGVWWHFLDPNASWSEVLRTPPVSCLPKNSLRAPPLDAANPTPAHSYLPIPPSSAKLKMPRMLNPNSPHSGESQNSFLSTRSMKLPPSPQTMSESELDPYFVNLEISSRELETLLQGNIQKVNRRMLNHYLSLAEDLAELGARYNGFSLSEHCQSLAVAIEKIGQAADGTYIATGELGSQLSATFLEPMREEAQFSGIMRNVLRFRVLKRVQQDMTIEELEKKKILLENLERIELEANRIDRYLNSARMDPSPQINPSISTGPLNNGTTEPRAEMQNAPFDSQFPPTNWESFVSPRKKSVPNEISSSSKRIQGAGNFMTSKIFGRINHALQGIVDVDPEKNRRDQIAKTRESLIHLEQALEISKQDMHDTSVGVLKDLRRFQSEKEEDLKRIMTAFARSHIDWAKRNQAAWEEAKAEVENIRVHDVS